MMNAGELRWQNSGGKVMPEAGVGREGTAEVWKAMTACSAETHARKLGVVTVTFNAADFLRPFLDCCLAQTFKDFELLVIDNASFDKTMGVLSAFVESRFTVIRNEHNVGYAAACNQGARYHLDRGVTDVLFINNDTEFGPDLFELLWETRACHDADAITPRISYSKDTNINWYAGGRFTFWKGFQAEHLGIGQQNDPSDTQPRWTPVAPGCCVLFSSSTFERIGFFDENYFVYFEDTDYFIRMNRAGLRLLYAPAISIAHKVSLSTGGPQSDFTIRYCQRNQVYLLRQHFGLSTVSIQVVLIMIRATINLLVRRETINQFVLRLSSISEGLKMSLPTHDRRPASKYP